MPFCPTIEGILQLSGSVYKYFIPTRAFLLKGKIRTIYIYIIEGMKISRVDIFTGSYVTNDPKHESS